MPTDLIAEFGILKYVFATLLLLLAFRMAIRSIEEIISALHSPVFAKAAKAIARVACLCRDSIRRFLADPYTRKPGRKSTYVHIGVLYLLFATLVLYTLFFFAALILSLPKPSAIALFGALHGAVCFVVALALKAEANRLLFALRHGDVA